MVELALIFPVLAVLVFAGIDLSRAVLSHNALTNGAREGARFGITHPQQITSADAADPNNVKAHVTTELQNATVSLSNVTINVYYVKSDGTTLDAISGRSTYQANTAAYPYLRVDVSYTYNAVTPLLGNLLNSVLNLKSSTTMAIE